MTERIMQESLFETPKLLSSRQLTKTGIRNSERNSAISFGITKTGLNKESYDVLENIFYGINNLDIPLKMLGIENPAEILANYFAAGRLKKRNAHFRILDIVMPDFFRLINYINQYSYGNGKFVSLANNFRKYFDDSPGKQRRRLGLLEQNVRDKFIESFFTPYRPSNREEPFTYAFYDPNCDGRDKGIYAKRIYEELKSLSERFKKLLL